MESKILQKSQVLKKLTLDLKQQIRRLDDVKINSQNKHEKLMAIARLVEKTRNQIEVNKTILDDQGR